MNASDDLFTWLKGAEKDLAEWYEGRKVYAPLLFGFVGLIAMLAFNEIWIEILAAVAIVWSVGYAIEDLRSLRRHAARNLKLARGHLREGTEAIKGLHGFLHGGYGLPGGPDRWYNTVWRWAGLEEKGGPS